MNRRAWIMVWALAGIVIVASSLTLATRHGTSAAAVTGARPAVDVPLAPATFGPYVTSVHAGGRVGAPSGSEAKLAFANAGIVARLDVHVGEAVSAGQALAELETAGIFIDVAQARSDAAAAAASYGGGRVPGVALAGARARLAVARDRLRALASGTSSAQSDRAAALAASRASEAKLSADQRALDRATQLYAGGVTALKDVEAARAQLLIDRADADANRARATSSNSALGAAMIQARADMAQAQSDTQAAEAAVTVTAAQLGSAQARLAAAQRNLTVATLTATTDGVVSAILKHPGEAVDPTQPAIVVEPASSSDVTLTLAGDDARRVQPGDPVTLRVPSRASIGHGRVRSIVPSVDVTTQTTTVVVTGVPPNTVSGDAVEATIDVGKRYGILIPTSAIIEDPETGKSIVFVRERDRKGVEKFSSREITVESGDDTRTLIANGLRAGEHVAAQGAFDLLAPSGG